MNLLVENGTDLDAQNYVGDLALHQAISHDHLEFVRYLVQCGAKCELRNLEGLTPLQLVKEKGHRDLFDEMISEQPKKQILKKKVRKAKTPASPMISEKLEGKI